MIINPFKCENCGEELQPNDLQLGLNNKMELMAFCIFCGESIKVPDKKEASK